MGEIARAIVIFILLAVSAAPAGRAQVFGAPKPIPVPPIPAPPQIGPPPQVTLPAFAPPPPRPIIAIPDAADIARLPIPPEAAITPADKTDPVPPPRPGTETPAPPMASPGAAVANIQETVFIVDPGSARFSTAAENTLRDIAHDMIRNPAARLEVRTFSPAKAHNESIARRLSLSRFLAIREFLTSNGVGDDRIDGRPLASQANELNADRVELYIER